MLIYVNPLPRQLTDLQTGEGRAQCAVGREKSCWPQVTCALLVDAQQLALNRQQSGGLKGDGQITWFYPPRPAVFDMTQPVRPVDPVS